MKKKLISIMLTIAMVSTLSVTAFAADGDDVNAPVGTTPGAGIIVSNGAANITGDGLNAWQTENDDDALAKAVDNNGADINVWAKVIDSSTPTYKIDIAWGAMKFEYSSGEGAWDVNTHTYTGGGTGTAAWTVTGYVDGDNNKVTVTNHSNKAVDASFAYAMTGNPFNAGATTTSVVGNFFADNTKAEAAALVLDDNTTVPDILAGGKVSLHTADGYFATAQDKTNGTKTDVFSDANKVTTGREIPVFFAFSGKPDAGVGATLNDFEKVGIITVSVSPKDAITDGFEF